MWSSGLLTSREAAARKKIREENERRIESTRAFINTPEIPKIETVALYIDPKKKYVQDAQTMADGMLPVDISGKFIVERPRIIDDYIRDIDVKLNTYYEWFFQKSELNTLKGRFIELKRTYEAAIIELSTKQTKTRAVAPKAAAKVATKGAIKKAAPKAAKVPKTKLSASLRKSVWLTYIGDVESGRCLCCNVAVLTKNGYDCGHVIAEAKGGPATLQNLRPICKTCNTSMGTKNMEDFMRECGYAKSSAWFEKMEVDT